MDEKEQSSSAPESITGGTPYWTPSREELFDWLKKNAPSLAELYRGAAALLFGPSVPGYTRFVSHAVREIRNRLPGAITGVEAAGRVEYKGRLDDIGADWRRAGIAIDSPPSADGGAVSAEKSSTEVALPRKLARKIGKLLDDHDASREKPRDTAVRLFEGAAPRNQRFREALRPVVVQWMEVCDWFMKRTHDSGTADDKFDPAEFRKNFELFESTLLGIIRGVSTFFVNTDELDAILTKSATPENVEAAIARMGYGEYNRYFFERLQDPSWIVPLKAKQFFSSPPPAIKDDVEGTIAFPAWPESRFLIRMAKVAPEVVADVVLKIPATDNVRVHDDLADIALGLPGPLAAKMVPEAKTWVGARHKVLLDEKLGALVEKLIDEGQPSAALELAEKLLEVLPDPRPILVPEPVGHFDGWHYERLLNRTVPRLVESLGTPAFTLVCNLLDSAVLLGRQEGETDDPEDYSFIWREAIERGRSFSRGVTDALVSSVLQAGIDLVARKKASLEEVVAMLERRKWPVFHRIALYVLREFAEQGQQLIAERLTDPDRYNRPGITREFWLLAGKGFTALPEKQKELLLAWIDRGPDLEAYKRRIAEFTGEVVSEKEASNYGKNWRRDHFEVVKDGLCGKWKTGYEELVAEMGAAGDVTAVRAVSGGAFAPPSPKSDADIAKMTMPEIIAFLKTWKPSGEPMGERRAGLGAKLAIAVAAEPSKFSAAAGEFKGLDPTYVRELFQALLIPSAGENGIEWKEILDLGRWVVEQPPTIPERKGGHFDQDPDWSWTRSAIVRLLSAGFEADRLPVELRTAAWDILERITADENPTRDQEEQYLKEDNADPASLSINSVRGEALHGVIKYALWLRRSFEKQTDGTELTKRGFDEMPEVRKILERHLDLAVDRTLTTRSVYGRWLPWLQLVDAVWFENNLSKIFPVGESEVSFRDCAWTTYVVLCDVFDSVFTSLQNEYGRAVEKIGTFKVGKSHLGDPDSRLASHLMILYWRGRLPLPPEDGLLQKFFSSAPDKIRGEAIGFVGRTLKNDTGEIRAEVLERLKRLWVGRLETVAASPDKSLFRLELSQFGWWFVSGKFDDDWALDQLLATLRITRKAEADLWVAEKLRDLSAAKPDKAIECLSLMLDGDEEGWGMLGWRESAHKIVEAAVASPEAATREAARVLIHKLGGLGYFEYRQFLAEDVG